MAMVMVMDRLCDLDFCENSFEHVAAKPHVWICNIESPNSRGNLEQPAYRFILDSCGRIQFPLAFQLILYI